MNKIRIYFILLALTAVACNKDELITTDVEQVPIITFDTDPAVYPVKVGREFTITPSYQFVDRAVYSWKLEETGKIISTEPQLTYRFDSGNEISEGVNGYYIDLGNHPERHDRRNGSRRGTGAAAAPDLFPHADRRAGGRKDANTNSRPPYSRPRTALFSGRCAVRCRRSRTGRR